ncbi:hypothetical protein L486_00457 [Kwoniella mangroviensis CBS 10435]|uniref:C2H2-type domain-containing protein n=1 Tax=Kwoniella mangroviensis CBS 10435 TaxID=1331196 RepID=A0A1B9IZ63_9TREE|nr:uncharacterized protein I203_06223 [Kwoniella mangroviensis CBS 8507]OCF60817.1 hypothetical protein L486_00457 [Kwoniella mangroviensis CBS 10435]OCF64492.1 hypothetical protein I203_06223 [Kwoniella mangroviensis CBS 8507]
MESGPSCFRCTYQGCSKTFTRKDHLFRHAANHSEDTFNCRRCTRPFKRLDLLQRHEKRNICGDGPYQPPAHKRKRSEENFTTHNRMSNPPSTISSMGQTTSDSTGGGINPISSTSHTSSTSPYNSLTGTTTDHSGYMNNTANDLITTTSNQVPEFGFGFGLWAPEQWEALLHESLLPPFNEPIIPNISFQPHPQLQLTPYAQDNEIKEDETVMETLLSRLQMSFPELDISLSFMSQSLDLYWTRTAPTFPFIHRPTFDYSIAPSELIVLMIIVGSVHSLGTLDIGQKKDFSRLVSKIRSMLFQECGLEMPISILQSFTLCHVYDTWYGNSESLFVAQCMWPVMVAHSRKKGIGVLGKPETESQQEEAWTNWAKEEERRRSAYCVLLIDTQLSAFWNQHCSRQLSIFAHNLNLPCPKSQWEAESASEWVKIRQYAMTNNTPTTKPKHSKSGYLPGLHPEFTVNVVTEGYSSAIMSALSEEHKFLFKVDLDNSLTSQMVLIGLIAIAWDCRTRGGMGIRFREGTKHWRSIVFNAVIQLRAAYESAVMHMSASIESRDMRDTFAICIISVLSDIPMLHVAAGATTFCGASIGPRQYSDAKRRLKLWAKTDDAWTCVWQSIRYLRQALFSEWGLYSTWAVFNTTLVLWGYTTTISHPSTSSSNTTTTSSTLSSSEHPLNSTYPPATASATFTFTSSAPSIGNHSNNHDEEERQRRLTQWLESVLSTHGKLESMNDLDEAIRDLLEIVCEKLSGAGGEIDRNNSALLSRLIGQKKR